MINYYLILMVEVINLRTCKDWGKSGDVRIDRKSKWGNPFIMQNESQRDFVCDQYEIYLNQQLRQHKLDLNDLENAKRLGCHCSPKRCHGDYLKKILETKQSHQQSLNL
jgi:hypothetical protein